LLSYKRCGKTRNSQELLDRVSWRLSLNHSGGLDWLEEYRLVKKQGEKKGRMKMADYDLDTAKAMLQTERYLYKPTLEPCRAAHDCCGSRGVFRRKYDG
jgi:hypothetical protein